MTRGERVEQMALQPAAPDRRVVAGDPLANRLMEARHVPGTQGLGKLFIDLDRREFPDLFDVDGEDGFLARQLGIRILGRKSNVDIAVIAGAGPDQLVLEAWDEGGRAELQMVTRGGAAGSFDFVLTSATAGCCRTVGTAMPGSCFTSMPSCA